VHNLYPEFIKYLDDNNENIRFECCYTLRFFLKASAPQNYSGTIIEYIVEQHLFILLDDENFLLRDKVFEMLKVAIDLDSDLVIKQCRKALCSHSTRDYCDILLKLANENCQKSTSNL
jgi:hypothetical protein